MSSTLKLSAAFVGLVAAQACHQDPATTPTAPRPLARFAMHVKDGKATFEMLKDSVGTQQQGLHIPADALFSNNGTPLVGIDETFEAETVLAEEPGTGGCGLTQNCFLVRINSRLSRPLTQLLMRIDSTSSVGHDPVNDDPLPMGAGIAPGLSGAGDGVFNFGTVPAEGSSADESLIFSATAGSQYIVYGSFFEEQVGGGGMPVLIDFDMLPNASLVTNQFPSATFSAEAGHENAILNSAASFGTSVPNFICTRAVGGGVNCARETYVDFTSPVSNLTLGGIGINNAAGTTVANIRVFVSGVLAGTENVLAGGNGNIPVVVDLTAYSNVTRIELVNITDGGGIGWDDFSFDQ